MFQDLMREHFEAMIQRATGRPVIGLMSGNQQHPDMMCEVLILAPDRSRRRARAGEPGRQPREWAPEALRSDTANETAPTRALVSRDRAAAHRRRCRPRGRRRHVRPEPAGAWLSKFSRVVAAPVRPQAWQAGQSNSTSCHSTRPPKRTPDRGSRFKTKPHRGPLKVETVSLGMDALRSGPPRHLSPAGPPSFLEPDREHRSAAGICPKSGFKSTR
jgi:hypothetical protein